jgi:hypothetical protein
MGLSVPKNPDCLRLGVGEGGICAKVSIVRSANDGLGLRIDIGWCVGAATGTVDNSEICSWLTGFDAGVSMEVVGLWYPLLRLTLCLLFFFGEADVALYCDSGTVLGGIIMLWRLPLVVRPDAGVLWPYLAIPLPLIWGS